MKVILKIFLFLSLSPGIKEQRDIVDSLLLTSTIKSQQKNRLDSLHQLLSSAFTDSMRILDGKVKIRVADNGGGISQKILDNIFQPFFITKPTGEGTGLGLRLSYDIITKGHGGELKVNTKEIEGSEFIIVLPVHE